MVIDIDTLGSGDKGPVDPSIRTMIPADGPDAFSQVQIGQIDPNGEITVNVHEHYKDRIRQTGRTALFFSMN